LLDSWLPLGFYCQLSAVQISGFCS